MSQEVQYSSLFKSLELSVKKYPEQIAFVCGEERITYKSFFLRVNDVASKLYKVNGLRKNDKIILALGNNIDFCEVFYAAMSLGIIVIPISTKLTTNEIKPLIEQIKPSWILCNQKQINKYQGLLSPHTTIDTVESWEIKCEKTIYKSFVGKVEVNKNDTSVVIFTSGTTGKPKGAMLTHSNILHAIAAYQDNFNLTEKDSTVLAVPISHVTGLVAILGVFIQIGGCIHLHEKFVSNKIINCIDKDKITFLHGSPTVFILLCNEIKNTEKKYELESLRKIACGGGHLNDATINNIQESFKNSKIHPVYGLSETSSPASIFTENVINHEKIGSSGKAIPGVYFSIRNDKKEELTAGEAGELWIKGSVVITSYWCNADANKESFSGGWFNSGDLAYIDNEGYLYIKGRLKDMINRGGEKIYPLEVENLLTNYPGVNEVAIVPYPSEVYGEECIAFIITDTSRTITTKEIIEWAFINLARYKIPRKVVFVVDLPRTNNGKINKRILKDNIQKYL